MMGLVSVVAIILLIAGIVIVAVFGWETFFVIMGAIVAVTVTIVVLVKMRKKKKSLENLKNSGGYEVALQIKDALVQAGFEISYESMYYYGGGHWTYHFSVRNGGEVRTDNIASQLIYKLDLLRKKNADAHRVHQGGCYGAIYNHNLHLLAESDQKSQEVPPFLRIVAEVMSNSKYEFHHPQWMFDNPESKGYLNVMFQQ